MACRHLVLRLFAPRAPELMFRPRGEPALAACLVCGLEVDRGPALYALQEGIRSRARLPASPWVSTAQDPDEPHDPCDVLT